MFFSDGIGGVGIGRRAFVSRDHEIGILAIANHDLLRVDHFGPDDIVSDRQQRADEQLVAGLAFDQPAIAVTHRIGKLLGIEAAFGSGRHNYRILDPLGLHQAQHFGAEVIAPVRPAQPAARNRAGAQVDAFYPPRIDEDFAPGQRLG